MILRHQLPVWSPVTLSALIAGLVPRKSSPGRIADRVRAEYGGGPVQLTSSGTVALALAFRASAPAGERPRIALPAWGCYDLMTAADAVDATVLLYDLDPGRLVPDPVSLDAVLAQAPHAVVVAHWFGIPIDLAAIREEAGRRGIVLIDDAAQAVGSYLGASPAGALGDLGILSFGRGKGRTGGSGGALVPTTARGVEVMSRLLPVQEPASGWKFYASLWAQWALGRPSLYGLPRSLPVLGLGQTVYRSAPELRGLPARNAEVLGRVWDRSTTDAKGRGNRAQRWRDLLQNRRGVRLIEVDREARPGWLRFPILASGESLESLTSPRAEAAGIARGYRLVMVELPVSSGRILNVRREFPGARALAATLLTLPTHSMVSDRDFSIVEALHI